MVTEAVIIKGREIAYEIRDLDIYSLEYYKENPRINHIISKYSPEEVTQELIEEKLVELDSTKELIKDLEENKGLLDEVYVLGNRVVEGNRRLCAYRRLHKREGDDKWRYIKGRILHGDVSEDELFFILSTFHIKGKQQWDAYEKASYIHRMVKILNKSPEEVGRELRLHRKTVESMMKAYQVMSQRYLPSLQDDELVGETRDELRKYSYFEAFFRQKNLSKRFEETPGFMDDFIDWVKTDRLKKAQNVRELPKILNNKKACKTLYEEDADTAYDEAIAVLYYQKPEKIDPFYSKVREFRDLLREAEPLKVRTEVNANKNKRNQLHRCYKELRRFCKDVGLDIR